MALGTQSKFYYGFEIDSTNNKIDFDEGGPELTATLSIGEYSATEIALEVQNQLNAEGALTYTVTFNRTTRIFTIAATGVFSLLITSGTNNGTSAYGAIGFTGADVTGFATYSGAAAGSSYLTQFFIQDYTSADNWVKAADASVNKSASGKVEVISFGVEAFFEGNLKFVTDRDMTGGFIRNNPTGVSDLRQLMTYLITKAPVEFMPDSDDEPTFYKIILESTPDQSNGTGFKLNELDGQGLRDFYETGVLKFRVVE